MPPPPPKTVSAKTRWFTVFATALLSLLTVVVAYDRPWSGGWLAGVLALTNTALFLAQIACCRDAAMARLLVFGLTLGVVELVADALCVRFTGTLDYSVAHSPLIGLSPWWMPLAWMVIVSQIGFVGAWLMERVGPGRGVFLTALLGAVNLPFYEEMAFHAHWWQYQNCRFVGHAPVYVIVAELLIGATLAPLARRALGGPGVRAAFVAGLWGGLATVAGGLIGFGLIERIPRWLGWGGA